MLSVAGQFSDPFARDQLQTSERSQTAYRVALGECTPDSLPPPSPLDLFSWSSLTCPPLSSSVHRCAPLAPRSPARDSSRAVQFELTLSNTSCTLCRRTCEGLQKHMGWASFSFITKFVILKETLFFLLSFVFCLVLTRRACIISHITICCLIVNGNSERQKNNLMHKLIFCGFQSLLWVADIAIHGTPENQVLSRCECAAAGE